MSEFRHKIFQEDEFLLDELLNEVDEASILQNGLFEDCHFQTESVSMSKDVIKTHQTDVKGVKINSQDKKQKTCTNSLRNCNREGCGLKFATAKELRKHKLIHRVRKHKCDVPGCDAAFYERSKLKRHMVKHTKTKEFQCGECSNQFAYKDSLKAHERCHTGAKPFQCKFDGCGRCFSQAGNRNVHEKTHVNGKRKRKQLAAQLDETPNSSSHNAKVARIHEELSPLRPNVAPASANVFCFQSPAKVDAKSNIDNFDTSNLLHSFTDGTDCYESTPSALEPVVYKDLDCEDSISSFGV